MELILLPYFYDDKRGMPSEINLFQVYYGMTP